MAGNEAGGAGAARTAAPACGPRQPEAALFFPFLFFYETCACTGTNTVCTVYVESRAPPWSSHSTATAYAVYLWLIFIHLSLSERMDFPVKRHAAKLINGSSKVCILRKNPSNDSAVIKSGLHAFFFLPSANVRCRGAPLRIAPTHRDICLLDYR